MASWELCDWPDVICGPLSLSRLIFGLKVPHILPLPESRSRGLLYQHPTGPLHKKGAGKETFRSSSIELNGVLISAIPFIIVFLLQEVMVVHALWCFGKTDKRASEWMGGWE